MVVVGILVRVNVLEFFYHFVDAVDLVAAAEGFGGGEAEAIALVHFWYGVAVEAQLTDGGAVDAGGLTHDDDVVARTQHFIGLQLHFGHADAVEIVLHQA